MGGSYPFGVQNIVIVGASLAGVRAAETLRTSGYEGTITVIGDEPVMPYDRPPLSKNFLAGEWDADRVALRKPDAFDALNVEWKLGHAAIGLDTASNTVTLDDGSTVHYDGLVIATGGTVRTLPNQPDLQGVHVLRTLAHAESLRVELVEE